MSKITVTIDLTKIDKSRIQERKYTNKAGEEVTVKEYSMEVVPLKQPRALKKADGTLIEGATWQLMETHFACEAQTKAEREANKETVYIGKGTQLQDKNPTQANSEAPSTPAEEELDESAIPF
jgi:hypothetical protein